MWWKNKQFVHRKQEEKTETELWETEELIEKETKIERQKYKNAANFNCFKVWQMIFCFGQLAAEIWIRVSQF